VKAVILAGGKGIRGKPFTDYFPKAMIPINGKPLIDYVVNHLFSYRIIDEIIIISDFKGIGAQIKHYFENRKGKKIKFVQDSGNGTAGDLLHISNSLKKDSEFVLWFVDNLCAIDIKKMYQNFKKKNSFGSISTRSYRKEETGFAVVNEGIITKFIEKPNTKLKNPECLGIYIINTKILDMIKTKNRTKKSINLSSDIFEKLVKEKIFTSFDIGKTIWLDIESPTIVERYQKEIKKILKQMKN